MSPRRKSAGSGGKGIWIALAAAAAVLLIGGTGLALVLRGRGGPGGPGSPSSPSGQPGGGGSGENTAQAGRAPANLLAYAPNDTFVVGYANVKDQLKAFDNAKSQVRLHATRDTTQFEKDYGPLENIEEVLSAQRSGDFTRGNRVLVVRFSRPPDRSRLTAGGKEQEARGKKYHEMKQSNVPGDYLYFPSDTLLVRADTRGLMEEVIGGDVGKFPEWFQKLIDSAPDGYVVEVRRAPREGGFISTAGPIGRVQSKTKSGDTVTISTVEEYKSEEATQEGRKDWAGLSARKLPREEITIRVSGTRILVNQSAQAEVYKTQW
jgi:hypothetical protein